MISSHICMIPLRPDWSEYNTAGFHIVIIVMYKFDFRDDLQIVACILWCAPSQLNHNQ